MPVTDEDRRLIADLAMRAIDTILEDYGEEAELCAATLVFEVKTVESGEDEDPGESWEGNQVSLEGQSPFHTAGLLSGAATHLMA